MCSSNYTRTMFSMSHTWFWDGINTDAHDLFRCKSNKLDKKIQITNYHSENNLISESPCDTTHDNSCQDKTTQNYSHHVISSNCREDFFWNIPRLIKPQVL